MLYQTQLSNADCISKLNQLKSMMSAADYNKAGVHVQEVRSSSFTLSVVGEYFGQTLPMLRCKGEVSDNPEAGGAEINGGMEFAVGFKAALLAMVIAFMIPSIIIMLVGRTSGLGYLFMKYHVNFFISMGALLLVGMPLLKFVKNTRERVDSFFKTELAAECLDK